MSCLQNFQTVKMPAGVETINAYFCHKRSMPFVVDLASAKYLGVNAFSFSVLCKITITKSVKNIDDDCFRGCRQLKEVVFAEGSVLRRIGKRSSLMRRSKRRWELPFHCRNRKRPRRTRSFAATRRPAYRERPTIRSGMRRPRSKATSRRRLLFHEMPGHPDGPDHHFFVTPAMMTSADAVLLTVPVRAGFPVSKFPDTVFSNACE